MNSKKGYIKKWFWKFISNEGKEVEWVETLMSTDKKLNPMVNSLLQLGECVYTGDCEHTTEGNKFEVFYMKKIVVGHALLYKVVSEKIQTEKIGLNNPQQMTEESE